MKPLLLAHKKTTTSVQEFPNSARGGRKEGITNTNPEPLYHTSEWIDGGIQADYCLVIQGNKMSTAGFRDGDVVFIQSTVPAEDMELVVVLIGGEYALRRVIKMGNVVKLYGVGVRAEPLVYDENAKVRMVGRVVEMRRRLLRPVNGGGSDE